MAERGKDIASLISSNSVFLALLLTLGAAWLNHEAPLQGARPGNDDKSQGAIVLEQKAPVRLWDDPLKAVPAAPQTAKSDNEPTKDAACRFSSRTLFLGVMLPGQNYTEREEFRRRIRYAVEAAAAKQGFRSRDTNYLQVAKLPLSTPSGAVDVPYECLDFKPTSPQKDSKGSFGGLVIAWLDEDRISETNSARSDISKQLQSLEGLIKQLARSEQSAFRILGPSDSDTLCDMGEPDPGTKKSASSPIDVYSYAASNPACYDSSASGFKITRTIATDNELASALANELELRHINFKTDAIALLSEYETSYARHVVKAMRTGLRPRKALETGADPAVLPKRMNDDVEDCPGNKVGPCALVRQYPRGLDGTKSGAKESDSKSKSGSDDKTSSARDYDRYEGPSQFDYLRRLADDLLRVDAQRRASGQPGIRAIGLVGSDVYDKLLLLRALKPAFPSAVFFTTDLDASLLTSSERPYARNLIVASGHGAALSSAWQGFVPPFRSVHQTSAFLATQVALTDAGELSDERKSEISSPRIFEIARRSGFNELATKYRASFEEQKPAGPVGTAPVSLTDMSIRPPLELSRDVQPTAAFWLAATLCLLLAALLIIPLVSPRDSGARRDVTLGPELKPLVVAGFASCLVLLGFAIFFWKSIAAWIGDGGQGETLQLAEGVSVWPTIGIRLFVIAIAIVFLLAAHTSLKANDREIETRFKFAYDPSKVKDIENSWYWFSYFRLVKMALEPRELAFIPDDRPGESSVLSVAEGWRRYRYADRPAAKLFRVLISTVGATCLAWLFYTYIKDVEPPIRGDLAHRAFQLSLLAEFVMLALATFYVADTTLLCLIFVNDLQYHPNVDWSPDEREPHTEDHYRQSYNRLLNVGAATPEGGRQMSDSDSRLSWEVYNDRRALQFLEMRTSAIVPLVYWPFFMIAMAILAHSQIFAAYPYSATVALAEGSALAIILACALALNLDAEDTRNRSVSRLERIILKAKAPGSALAELRPQLEDMLARTSQMTGGAFSPVWAQPIIKGLVLPLLGFSAKFLLESNWWTNGW